MPIKPKTRRLLLFLLMGGILIAGVTLVLQALRENLIFFYTPSEFKSQRTVLDKKVRLGGLIQEGSVRPRAASVSFQLTDRAENLTVFYTGVLPDLFREGQGVVVEGRWMARQGVFQATTVFAKHDETYMPQEIADALKRQGTWKGDRF